MKSLQCTHLDRTNLIYMQKVACNKDCLPPLKLLTSEQVPSKQSAPMEESITENIILLEIELKDASNARTT